MSYEIEYIYKKGSIVSFEESGRGGSDSLCFVNPEAKHHSTKEYVPSFSNANFTDSREERIHGS
jgi:hypothetical protein